MRTLKILRLWLISYPGTAGQMFSALGGAGVNIEMISQGASEINISCVIKEEDTEAGLRAVHRSFLEAP